MPNSYILNKVNFQQKKKKEIQIQIEIEPHQNVKKNPKLNNIQNVKKKIKKKRNWGSQKLYPSKKPNMCTIKYSMFKI